MARFYGIHCTTSVDKTELSVPCCRPNSAILHIVGRMDPRQMKSAREGKGLHDEGLQGPDKFPVLLVSTSADDESVVCQEIVDVDAKGTFHTDVAVSNEASSWAVMVSSCGSGNGKHKGSRCRMVDVSPTGKQSNDYCHSTAIRAVPPGTNHPGKSYYVAKVDFRRCVERRPDVSVKKPRVVTVRRSRRQAVRPETYKTVNMVGNYFQMSKAYM